MIGMAFLGLPALSILWLTDVADIACGAIALAVVTYGCFHEYESELGLWMLSPLFGVIFIFAASTYLLPPSTSAIEQRGVAPAFAYIDWLIGVLVGTVSFVWFVVAVAKNLRHTSQIRGTKSPVIVDGKDLREP